LTRRIICVERQPFTRLVFTQRAEGVQQRVIGIRRDRPPADFAADEQPAGGIAFPGDFFAPYNLPEGRKSRQRYADRRSRCRGQEISSIDVLLLHKQTPMLLWLEVPKFGVETNYIRYFVRPTGCLQ